MLQCCLNGARPGEGRSVVPTTADELAADARAVAGLGVTSLHVHPRARSGHEDLSAATVADVVGAIRHAAPGTEIVVPLARWIEPDPYRRTELVAHWAQLPPHQRPDTAAINVHDTGWRRVCEALEAAGLGIELGVWTPGDAVALHHSDIPRGTVRVVAEVTVTDPDVAVLEAVRLLETLGTVPVPVLLHGEDGGAWPVLDHAVRTDLDARIGVEDTLCGPADATPRTNVDLVRTALSRRPAPDRTSSAPPMSRARRARGSAPSGRRPRHRR